MPYRLLVIIFCLLLPLQNTQAYVAAAAWQTLKSMAQGAISGLTEMAVQKLAGDKKDDAQLLAIQNQLAQMQQKLNESQHISAENQKQTQLFVNKSQEIINKLQSGHLTLEDRVKLVEQSLPQLKNYVDEDTAKVMDAKMPKYMNITYGYRPQNTGELRVLTQNATLHSEDSYKLSFTPEKDSYLYILQVDSQDNLGRLFPITEWDGITLNQSSHVKAGQTYYAPSESHSFSLDQRTGTEKIYLIVSNQPEPALEKLPNKSKLADIKAVLVAGRGVGGIVKDPQNTKQAFKMEEGGKIQYLNKQQLIGYCEYKGCVNVLSFEHR